METGYFFFHLRRLGLLAVAVLGWARPAGAELDAATAGRIITAYNRGVTAFEKQDWATAIASFEESISIVDGLPDPLAKAETMPKMAPAFFSLGASAFNLPDFAKCIAVFERFEREYPAHEKVPEARRALGRAAFAHKDFEKALAIFADMEKYPSQRDQALQIQAECHREMQKFPEMEAALAKLISGGLNNAIQANACVQLAMSKLSGKKFEELEPLVALLISRRHLVENVVTLNHLIVKLGDDQAEKSEYEKASRTYLQVLPRDQVIAFQSERITALERRIAANDAAAAQNPQAGLGYQAQNADLQPFLAQSRALLAEFMKLPDYMPGMMLRHAMCWNGQEKKWEGILVNERILERYPDAEKEREAALYGCVIGYAEVKQFQICQDLCEHYMKSYPKGPNIGTVAYVQGAVSMESGDLRRTVRLFTQYIKDYPETTYAEEMHLLLGGAHFTLLELEEARQVYLQYIERFPMSPSIEEVKYRAAIIPVFQGKYEEGLKATVEFLREFPQSVFAPDAKYRWMVCLYAASEFDAVISAAESWLAAHGGKPMNAEVLALKGDCLKELKRLPEAADAYLAATKAEPPDQVLTYSLSEASEVLHKMGDTARLSGIWEEFIQKNPDHQHVVAAIYWISRAKTKEGKVDEAKAITVEQLKRSLNNHKNESVEMLLSQLAQLCWKRPRQAPGQPDAETETAAKATAESVPLADAASLPEKWDALGELDRQLAPLEATADVAGVPRLNFARMEMMKLLKKPEEADALMRQITLTKPESLSPQLLGMAGEFLQDRNSDAEAEAFFEYLKENFHRSAWLDYAYHGLGKASLARGEKEEALRLFTLATEEYAGAKIRESTMGRGLALMETGQHEEAKEIFQQVAGTREWRGETTAQAVYCLGEVAQRQNRLPEAIAHYQRVFTAYQKYVPWMEKAYLKAAECFDKLGKRPEAVAHLREAMRHEKLGTQTKAEAQKILGQWGVAP